MQHTLKILLIRFYFIRLTLKYVNFQIISQELTGSWSCCQFAVGLSLISECVIVVPVAEKQVSSAQIREHRGAVLDLIEVYLRGEYIQLITIHTAHV